MYRQKIVLLIVASLWTLFSLAQKVISEATITYEVTVLENGGNPALANAFAGASQELLVKGYQARWAFVSPLRSQTVLFNARSNSAVLLRETGNEKYMTEMSPDQWQIYLNKHIPANLSETGETREIAGYVARKLAGKQKDGGDITIFYSPDIAVMAKGYDGRFNSVNGFPLAYVVSNNGVVVEYKVKEINVGPVSGSRFDKPTSGYKILEYRQ